MKYTIEEFAQEIRKLFPGNYDDLSDYELVELWLKKYPQDYDKVETNSKYTEEEFAQEIRKVFPGNYDDLSDNELVRLWLKKYPQDAEKVDIKSKYTVNEFAQEIRNQYPEDYNDLSDEELVKLWVSKYPNDSDKINLIFRPPKQMQHPPKTKKLSKAWILIGSMVIIGIIGGGVFLSQNKSKRVKSQYESILNDNTELNQNNYSNSTNSDQNGIINQVPEDQNSIQQNTDNNEVVSPPDENQITIILPKFRTVS